MPIRRALTDALPGLAAAVPGTLQVNTGLWIDKMLVAEESKAKERGEFLRNMLGKPLPIPEGYGHAFTLRAKDLENAANDDHASIFDAQAQGRFVVGLGAKGVLEMGIQLDRTWGVPYLPGSALKGLAATAAHQLGGDPSWRKPVGWPEAKPSTVPVDWTDYQVLFGTTAAAGAVSFLDAWWRPSGGSLQIDIDVMTVHHPEYYQSGSSAPTDFDEPDPNTFLSAHGTFLVGLEGPRAWRAAAEYWLRVGLEQLGLGAKTSSAYGRFDLKARPTARQKQRAIAKDKVDRVLADFKPQHKQAAVVALVEAAELGVVAADLSDAVWKLPKERVDELLKQAASQLPSKAAWFETLLKRLATPAPVPTTPQVIRTEAPPTVHWERSTAWAEKDGTRIHVRVGQAGQSTELGKLQDKPSEVLKSALLGASKATPLDVEVWFDGRRLKGIRTPT